VYISCSPSFGRVDTGEFTRVMQVWMDGPKEGEQEMYTPVGHVAAAFALDGPNQACQTACAASSQAIGEALDIVRCGEADVMVAGGSHSMIHPLGITGFNRLTALSHRNDSPRTASRPFDATRDGFVIGEGAGLVVLEELEHAKKRGATISAELTGYGTTADAYRMTDPHPEGRGAIRAMADAISDANLRPTDIGYINAHGTSTRINDATETLAIKSVFGDAARKLMVSSTKSMTGHMLGAAGGVETAISALALHRSVLPPTINYETPDPECDLDYVPNVAREKRVRHALSNSFGFGGQNISLIVSRFDKKLAKERRERQDLADPTNWLAIAAPDDIGRIKARWDLPSIYLDFLTRFSPINVLFESPRFWNCFELFGAAELIEAQAGYSFDPDTQQPFDYWPVQLVVIASHDGDPFVIDLSKSDGADAPIETAEHGAGVWTFHRVAGSFCEFLEQLLK
jgi:hypothetical protein